MNSPISPPRRWPGNTSSVVSTRSLAGAYRSIAPQKAAVDALTRSLAKELGSRHIRLDSVNPGMVETDRAGRVRVQPERCSFQQVI